MAKCDPRTKGAKCNICPLGPGGFLRQGGKYSPWQPIAVEDHRPDGAVVAAVATAPDSEEEDNGRLFSGRFGGLWNKALRTAGLARKDLSLIPLMSCAPPGQAGGAMQRMNDRLRQENKRRDKAGQMPLPSPMECCAPRLMTDLAPYKFLVLLGKEPVQALSGITRGVEKVRGSPWGLNEHWVKVPYDDPTAVRKALPTYAPGVIFRAPQKKRRWISDIRKSWRLFTNTLDWEDPVMELRPTPQRVIEWFNEIKPTTHLNGTIGPPVYCDDVETTRHPMGMRPASVTLRTVSFARWKDGIEGGAVECIGIPLLSCDGVTRFYTSTNLNWLMAILQWALMRPDIYKIGHNAGSFDRIVYEEWFKCTPPNRWDSLFPTRAADPSLPKGLKPVGRTRTDVGEWDSDEEDSSIATGTTDDHKLLIYNCIDTAVNLRIWPKIVEDAAPMGYFNPIPERLLAFDWWNGPDNKGWDGSTVPSLFDIDHANQDRCVYFYRAGFDVDQAEVDRQLAIAEAQVKEIGRLLTQKIRKMRLDVTLDGISATDEGSDDDSEHTINPSSTMQLRKLYFEEWDLPFLPKHAGKDSQGKPLYSKRDFLTTSDSLSTSDAVHRAYLAWGSQSEGNLSSDQRDFMYLVRMYRRINNKIISTSLKPMRPSVPIKNKSGKLVKMSRSWLYEDGKVHSNFSAHITSVGRDSSSGPNLQNIGNKKGQGDLKKIYVAGYGHILFGADINQAHLVIIANEWKIPALCDVFANGYDPHNFNAESIFKRVFTDDPGYRGRFKKPVGGSGADRMRSIAKTFIYASVYGASPETIWRVLTSNEGNPPKEWLAKIMQMHVYARDEKSVSDIGALIAMTMPNLGMHVDDVRDIHAKWLRDQPQWQDAWARAEEEYRINGFVKSYLFGRCSGDLGDDPNKIRNFSVLATERDVMAMIEGRIERAFPRGATGPHTGLIYQCHDSGAVRWKLPSHIDPMWRPSKPALKLWADERDPSLFLLEIAENLVTLTNCFSLDIPDWQFGIRGEADVGWSLKDV